MYQRYSVRNEGQTLQHNIHMMHKLKVNLSRVNITVQKRILIFHYEFFCLQNFEDIIRRQSQSLSIRFLYEKSLFESIDNLNQQFYVVEKPYEIVVGKVSFNDQTLLIYYSFSMNRLHKTSLLVSIVVRSSNSRSNQISPCTSSILEFLFCLTEIRLVFNQKRSIYSYLILSYRYPPALLSKFNGVNHFCMSCLCIDSFK